MYIETWRWRLVLVGVGVVLVWTGGHGILNPDDVPLNICYSPDVVFLQRLNVLASTAAFLAVGVGGGSLIWAAAWSGWKSFGIREERAPLDWRNVFRSLVAVLLLLGALVVGIWLTQRMLGDIKLHPVGPVPEQDATEEAPQRSRVAPAAGADAAVGNDAAKGAGG